MANQPLTQYTARDVRALRLYCKASRGWTVARFAKEIRYSVAYVKALESGRLHASAKAVSEMNRIAREEAFLAKEIEATNNEVLDWLVTALEQRKAQVKGNVRRRLKKLLE